MGAAILTGSGRLAVSLDERLLLDWHEAAADARAAYCHWQRTGSDDACFVYRASADRADAAQDALARRS